MDHDVFIAYATEDKATADAVCAGLEARRIRCWIAPRDVLAGREYAEAIVDAIAGSRVLVLVFSKSANASVHVRREVERAVNQEIPILPFRIQDVEMSKQLKYFVGAHHWLDALTPPLERHIERLGASVAALVGSSTARTPGAVPSNQPPLAAHAPEGLSARSRWRAALLLLLLAPVGAAGYFGLRAMGVLGGESVQPSTDTAKGPTPPPAPPEPPAPEERTDVPAPVQPTPAPTPPSPPAWEAALQAALSAAQAENWPEAERQAERAAQAGMPRGDIPTALASGLAAYAAPPSLVVEAPVTGSVLTTLEVRVTGVLTTGRASDRVFVNGEAVPLAGQRFEHVLRFDGADAARLEVEVRDGVVVRLSLAPRTYRYVRPIPLLLASLRSTDEAARRKASEDLVRLGPAAAPAVPQLLGLTVSRDASVAASAVATLAALGAPVAVQLIAAMRAYSPAGTHEGAFRALVSMGLAAVPALIESFQGEPDDPGATYLFSPMMALGRIGALAVPHLLEAMRSTDAKHVKRAYYAVEALARVLELEPKAADEQRAPLEAQLLQCLTTTRRFGAAWSRYHTLSCLGMVGAGSQAVVDAIAGVISEATPVLAREYRPEDSGLRVEAGAALGALASLGSSASRALPVLRELERRLRSSSQPSERLEVLHAIGAITGEYGAYVDALSALLDRPEQSARLHAILDLGRLGTHGEPAAAKLRAMLDRKEVWTQHDGARDWYTYAEAAVAYWKITGNNRDLVARLAEVLKNVATEDGVRWAVALGEAYGGEAAAKAYLRKALADPDLRPWARMQAEEALAKLDLR